MLAPVRDHCIEDACRASAGPRLTLVRSLTNVRDLSFSLRAPKIDDAEIDECFEQNAKNDVSPTGGRGEGGGGADRSPTLKATEKSEGFESRGFQKSPEVQARRKVNRVEVTKRHS